MDRADGPRGLPRPARRVKWATIRRSSHCGKVGDSGAILSRTPVPDPNPVSEAAAAATFRDAWNRACRQPPFAAAADSDLQKASTEIGAEEFETLLKQLNVSKWATLQLQVPPTLHPLLNALYRERVILGEFRDQKRRYTSSNAEPTIHRLKSAIRNARLRSLSRRR